MIKVFLDAGHGGKDSGAVGNGLSEKNVVLDLAKRIESKLKEYKNVEVMLSRSTDVFLELSERTDKANKWGADVFLSLHLNANVSTGAKGFESYIFNGSITLDTIALQNTLHQEITRKFTGTTIVDRGKKRANFHVLRQSKMKAILTENLFISNASDASHLKRGEFLDALAEGHVVGLEKFFGLERTIRPPTEKEPEKGETLYQVIAGTFSKRENADSLMKNLIKNGYKAYVQKKE